MAKQLLSNFGKRGDTSFTTNGIAQGLADISVDIEDDAHLSNYFKVVEFEPVFTAGKNSISFNGSDFLKDGSEIKVEVLDADGNSLYLAAPPPKSNFVDIANFTVAIYVNKETVSGAGKVFLAGTTTKGETVRWSANITINTTYQNVSRVRFLSPMPNTRNGPYMEPRPLLYPVIQNTTGSSLSTTVTVSGSFYLRVENSQGYFSPGNSNYGFVLPSDATIVVWSADAGNANSRVDSFNGQMEGQPITLHYDVADVKTQDNPPIYQYKHYDVTATINTVRSTNEIEISTIPLGPIAQLTSSGGQFTSSYTKVTYLQQLTTVPCTSVWVHDTLPGYMETHVNTNLFTSSMVGQSLTMKYSSLTLDSSPYPPFNPAVVTYQNHWPVTASNFDIISVTGSRIIHTNPFTYSLRRNTGFGSTDVHYTVSQVTGSITVLSASNPYQQYVDAAGSASLMKKSYVDIVYRNLNTFSGYVARHKLYARSNIYPGNFELIDDTVLGPSELLVDPITANKNFSTLGDFSNQDHINQYWFASSASLNLIYSDKPRLNTMIIRPTPDFSAADGNSYVIVKAGAVGVVNDANYYPYDAAEFSEFSGVGYTSNFIFVQENVLLTSDVIMNKNKEDTAKVMFFLTSSSDGIMGEKDYTPPYGLKLGEIVVSDKVASRVFAVGDAPKLFFTPLHDYYGTLIIVPVNCEVQLSNVSLKNYGDYGYSPGACVVQIPFPINIANEKWTLKSELFDANYNLIYTLAPVEAIFDPAGASLFGSSTLGSSGGSGGVPSTLPTLTLTGQLYMPAMGQCNVPHRFMGYNIPQHAPPLSGEGSVCYTQVSDLSLIPTNTNVTTKDYISVTTEEGSGTHVGRAIALRYSGSTPNVFGRRVYVDPLGNKTTYL